MTEPYTVAQIEDYQDHSNYFMLHVDCPRCGCVLKHKGERYVTDGELDGEMICPSCRSLYAVRVTLALKPVPHLCLVK